MNDQHLIEHTAFLRVRYADTDQMGIVYYGKYFEYFEFARTEMLRACGLPYSVIESLGFALPVLAASAKYSRGAKYDELLAIRCTMPIVHSPRLVLTYEIRLDGEEPVIVSGETTLGFVSMATGRPTRPPPQFSEAVERYKLKLQTATDDDARKA